MINVLTDRVRSFFANREKVLLIAIGCAGVLMVILIITLFRIFGQSDRYEKAEAEYRKRSLELQQEQIEIKAEREVVANKLNESNKEITKYRNEVRIGDSLNALRMNDYAELLKRLNNDIKKIPNNVYQLTPSELQREYANFR